MYLPDLHSVFQMESSSRILFVKMGIGPILLQNDTIGGNWAKRTSDLLFLTTTCETTVISIKDELIPKKHGQRECFIN